VVGERVDLGLVPALLEVDERGRMKLSRKALLPKE